MKASEIMSTGIECCTPDQRLQDVANMMVNCDCGIIPVVEDHESKRLLGVVTDRDIVCRAVAKGMDVGNTPASLCMSANPKCVSPDDNVEHVEEIMSDMQVRRVPVVENDCICGMISQADLALSQAGAKVAQVVENVSKPYAS